MLKYYLYDIVCKILHACTAELWIVTSQAFPIFSFVVVVWFVFSIINTGKLKQKQERPRNTYHMMSGGHKVDIGGVVNVFKMLYLLHGKFLSIILSLLQ